MNPLCELENPNCFSNVVIWEDTYTNSVLENKSENEQKKEKAFMEAHLCNIAGAQPPIPHSVVTKALLGVSLPHSMVT